MGKDVQVPLSEAITELSKRKLIVTMETDEFKRQWLCWRTDARNRVGRLRIQVDKTRKTVDGKALHRIKTSFDYPFEGKAWWENDQ